MTMTESNSHDQLGSAAVTPARDADLASLAVRMTLVTLVNSPLMARRVGRQH